MRRFSTFFVIIALLCGFTACSDDTGGITGGTGGVPGGTTGSQGDISFFNPTTVHTLKVEFTAKEWSNLSNDLYKSMYDGFSSRDGKRFSTELYRHARLLVNGTEIKDVGVRIRGNTSRFFPRNASGFHWVHWKISFSQDFSENEDVYGSDALPTLDKATKIHYGARGFILKHHSDDPSGIREALGYDLAARFGLMVPKFTFAKLVISVNGTEYNFGLYQVYEPVDKQFIRERFSGSSSYLFKCLWNDGGPATLTTDMYTPAVDIGLEKKDPLTVTAAASWNPSPPYNPDTVPVDQPWTPTYDLKAKETEITTARNMLNTLIMGIENNSGTAFNNWITTVLDVDSFLKACALNAMIGQWDDFCRQANNYYLLWNPTTSKWVFIPYDLDHSFVDEDGNRSQWSVSVVDWVANATAGGIDILLARKIMANTTWANAYKQHVRDLTDPMGTLFTPSAIQTRIGQLQAPINAAGIGTPVFSDSVALTLGGTPVSDIVSYVTARQTQAINEVGTNGGGGGFTSHYSQIYLRGNFNGWNGDAMTLVDHYTWRITRNMNTLDTFKFDDTTPPDWVAPAWGIVGQTSGQTSGFCSTSGDNITNHRPAGNVTVTFNDDTLAWSITGP